MKSRRKVFQTVPAAGAFLYVLSGFTPASARAEAFVSASVGRSDWNLNCAGQISCKVRDTAGTLRAGYWFSPYFGIEARYFDLGKASSVFQTGFEFPSMTPLTAEREFSVRGGGVDAIVSLPFAERFSVSALAGISRATATLKGTDSFSSFETSTRGNKPYYGVGVAYAISPNLSVSLEADRYRVALPLDTVSVDVWGAGLSYRFR
jgi:OOP family OmpA-OmpF porin